MEKIYKTMHIDLIRPYWRNPRINKQAILKVAKSIETYGYNQHIIVDKENVIIVGHSRYAALRMLGIDTVEVIVSELSESKAREYRIVDNRTGDIADWDDEKLFAELMDINDDKFTGTYFGDIDFQKINEKADDKLNPANYSRDNKDGIMAVCPYCDYEFEYHGKENVKTK